MILVGQEKRLAEPVRATRRERRAIKVFGVLLVASCLAAVLIFATRGPSGAHCVEITIPSYTGAVSAEQCGARAAAWCRQAYAAGAGDLVARAVRAACPRAGYPPPPRGKTT